MHSTAVIFEGAQKLTLGAVGLSVPKTHDVVVDVRYSGISTGTEKLFWAGRMPPFPGMGYPLIPGYEAMGEVVEAGAESGFSVGDTVFVPGADCYRDVRGLFGAASQRMVVPGDRIIAIDPTLGAEGALLALAATAHHGLTAPHARLPDLIVGHGVLGRLLARLTLIMGGSPPTVWDIDAQRQGGAEGYRVIHPDDDVRRDYQCIYDASGDAAVLDQLIARLGKGGEVVLAGFYSAPVQFAFPPAFMREARLRIAAEWTQDDLTATRDLIGDGVLNLSGLITHSASAHRAEQAYRTAFEDPACLKMILEWEGIA